MLLLLPPLLCNKPSLNYVIFNVLKFLLRILIVTLERHLCFYFFVENIISVTFEDMASSPKAMRWSLQPQFYPFSEHFDNSQGTVPLPLQFAKRNGRDTVFGTAPLLA